MKVLLFISILFINVLFAKNLEFTSGDNKISLVELYTSQGCSSCPLADRWLSKLKNDPRLFKEFIPIAFHVTYWNYIGWRDVFASKQNDNRQKNYAVNVWKNNSLYTPQFVVNAKEYRKWFDNKAFPTLKKQYAGNLKINIKNNKIEINYFNKNIKNEKIVLNIAVLGFGYDVNINEGENKNKTLHHDFVLLKHITKLEEIKNNRLNLNTELSSINYKNNKTAIVVWLSQYNSNILQSVGGYIQN